MSEWLDDFNESARLMQSGREAEAASVLDRLEPTIRLQPELTPNTYVLFEIRRAMLRSAMGDRDEALARFASAMKIAFHEVGDPVEVASVARKTLDTLCEWHAWDLLLKIASNMMEFGTQHPDMQMVGVTAAWYMPYALRGLSRTDEARMHAEAIVQRLELAAAEPEAIQGWHDFLKSLDED